MKRSEKLELFNEQLANYREATKNTEMGSAMQKFAVSLKLVNDRIESEEKQEEEWPKERKFKTPDGDICVIWGNKFHNWEGPAYIPGGNKKLAEYHLYGIQYSFEEWKEMKKQWEGLPWYKTPAILADAGTARN